MSEMVMIYTTFPDWESARRIVRALLEKKLIACANLREHEAHYWWEGKIEEGREVGALLKTGIEKWKEVSEFLRENHPYTTPAIIRVDVDRVNSEYLKWLLDVVG